jgi:hypothetical protein
MTTALITKKPQVVRYGGAREERFAYLEGDTYAQGDLIRISTTGTVELADATAVGSVHGVALSASADGGLVAPVLLFASDTVFSIQAEDGKTPADFTVGTAYQLAVTAGFNGLVDTSTNAVVLCVDKPATGQPWGDTTGTYNTASDEANGLVYVRVTQAGIDGAIAAA